MRKIAFLLALFSGWAHAHCPFELTSQGATYCVEVTWDVGEKKVRGQYEDSDAMSPYLVPRGEIPQKWIYSRAHVVAWEKSDSNHAPTEIPGFRVFPYMHMKNGHHHSTGYEFEFDPAERNYIIQRVVFQAMPGCWSLRWTTEVDDFKETSTLLLNIKEYLNQADGSVGDRETQCEDPGADGDNEGHLQSH